MFVHTRVTHLILSGILFFASADRLTKFFALNFLQKPIVILPQILELSFMPNRAMFFFWEPPTWIASLLLIGIFVMCVYILRQYIFSSHLCFIASTMIGVGAISNLIDRMWYGFVIDFINVPFWSVFNIADILIVCGLFLWIFFVTRRDV